MQQKKVINRHSDRKTELTEKKGLYTYKYTFSCSVCGYILKETIKHSLDTSISYSEACPNGCIGTIKKECSIIETSPYKYTKDHPYNK